MSTESTADRIAMIKQFGVLVNFVRGSGVGTVDWDAYGITDRDFVEVHGVESFRPVLVARYEDVFQPGQLQNTTYRATSVNVSGTTIDSAVGGYDIVAYREDGAGMVTLVLERQG